MKSYIALLSLSVLFLTWCGEIQNDNTHQQPITTWSIDSIQSDITTIEGVKDYDCWIMCNTDVESGIVQAEYSNFQSPELGITFSFISSWDAIINTVTRNWNLICVLANWQNIREDKVWCIEIINDTGSIMLPDDGTATLETLTDQNINYIKYSCDGCAPIDEASRTKTIKRI